jgi:hypothetical protein
MRIALTNQTLFGTRAITGWLTGDFDGTGVKLDVPLDGGAFLSIQPDGSYQGRAGVGGGYEMFKKQGSDLVCAYDQDGKLIVHVVPFKEL